MVRLLSKIVYYGDKNEYILWIQWNDFKISKICFFSLNEISLLHPKRLDLHTDNYKPI